MKILIWIILISIQSGLSDCQQRQWPVHVTTACYGLTSTFLYASCGLGKHIVVKNVYANAKPRYTNCPEESKLGMAIDPNCCICSPEDCQMEYSGVSKMNYYTECNGRQRCFPRVSWQPIGNMCSGRSFLLRSNYMVLEYYCVSDQNINPEFFNDTKNIGKNQDSNQPTLSSRTTTVTSISQVTKPSYSPTPSYNIYHTNNNNNNPNPNTNNTNIPPVNSQSKNNLNNNPQNHPSNTNQTSSSDNSNMTSNQYPKSDNPDVNMSKQLNESNESSGLPFPNDPWNQNGSNNRNSVAKGYNPTTYPNNFKNTRKSTESPNIPNSTTITTGFSFIPLVGGMGSNSVTNTPNKLPNSVAGKPNDANSINNGANAPVSSTTKPFYPSTLITTKYPNITSISRTPSFLANNPTSTTTPMNTSDVSLNKGQNGPFGAVSNPVSDNPNNASNNPISVSDNPNNVYGNPNHVSDNPNNMSDYPNNASENPNNVPDNPNKVSGNPNNVSGNPNNVSGNQNNVSDNPNNVSGNQNNRTNNNNVSDGTNDFGNGNNDSDTIKTNSASGKSNDASDNTTKTTNVSDTHHNVSDNPNKVSDNPRNISGNPNSRVAYPNRPQYPFWAVSSNARNSSSGTISLGSKSSNTTDTFDIKSDNTTNIFTKQGDPNLNPVNATKALNPQKNSTELDISDSSAYGNDTQNFTNFPEVLGPGLNGDASNIPTPSCLVTTQCSTTIIISVIGNTQCPFNLTILNDEGQSWYPCRFNNTAEDTRSSVLLLYEEDEVDTEEPWLQFFSSDHSTDVVLTCSGKLPVYETINKCSDNKMATTTSNNVNEEILPGLVNWEVALIGIALLFILTLISVVIWLAYTRKRKREETGRRFRFPGYNPKSNIIRSAERLVTPTNVTVRDQNAGVDIRALPRRIAVNSLLPTIVPEQTLPKERLCSYPSYEEDISYSEGRPPVPHGLHRPSFDRDEATSVH